MFTVLYRWRIKPGFEDQFIKSWSDITEFYVKNFASGGSRLHRGSDGLFYGYAQWQSASDRESAFEKSPQLSSGIQMKAAILESFPEIRFEIVADFLQSVNSK